MKAKDIMTTEVISVGQETPINKVVSILLDNQISGLPVIDKNDSIIGVISEQDLLYKEKLQLSVTILNLYGDYIDFNRLAIENRKNNATKASEIMSSNPVCVDLETNITKIAYLMLNKGIRRVFVLNNESKLSGIVTKADLLKIKINKINQEKTFEKKHNIASNQFRHLIARDLMTKSVISFLGSDTVGKIANTFHKARITGAPVIDSENKVIGIIAESDLIFGRNQVNLQSVYSEQWKINIENYWNNMETRADEIMTKSVYTVSEDTSIENVASLMIEKKIKRVPVICQKKLIGIITRADLLKAFLIAPKPKATAS